jgi:hypothetical protein
MLRDVMAAILYRCPATNMHTHAWLADEATQSVLDQREFVSLQCVACRRIHLVNPKTGTVLKPDDDA